MKAAANRARATKKKSEDMISSLYRYSDLSVEAIAHKVNMNPNDVQKEYSISWSKTTFCSNNIHR
jgi:hypothetical protein